MSRNAGINFWPGFSIEDFILWNLSKIIKNERRK